MDTVDEKIKGRVLPPEALYRRVDIEKFPFTSTADLDGQTDFIGHDRALEAMQFGIGIRKHGFNLYLLGPAGAGKYKIARSFLEKRAAGEGTPDEWCYINSFVSPDTPNALRLPPGRALPLRDDMNRLIEDLRSAIPTAFQSENYRARKHVIEQDVKDQQEKAFEEVAEEGQKSEIAMMRTPTGIILAPMKKGEVMEPQEFENLPADEHQRLENKIVELQKKLRKVLLQIPKWEQEGREKVRELNNEVAKFAVSHLLEELSRKYTDLPQVVSFLNDVQADVIEHVDEFLTPPEHPLAALMGAGPTFFRRYQVNVLVERETTEGAPVVFEDHPTYQNLVGQVQYQSHMGALTTDFTLIRRGALHRANGGYLILDAYKLLTQPYAWDALKRCLVSSQIRIESPGEMLGLVSTVSLRPEPIPVSVKVVLVGERMLYYMLSSLDSEFHDLFKVAADFEETMDRTGETELLFAKWIGTIAHSEGLLTFDRGAVGRVIEQCSRAAEDSRKILTLRRTLGDLLQEADYWARESKRTVVSREDVQRAIDAQIRRKDRIRERMLEATLRGTLMIDTHGERVGQINGLSVVMLSDFSFGHASRITARVRLGKGDVIDIEREVKLGGPLHSKGVLILSGFLGGRYAPEQPLSLQASLVFEQTYGGVEGDSASSAELYVLLSALSGLPLKQSLAVTGSVNQHGEVQAIGGVNEKIEGFFDLCKGRGEIDGQGVIIPRSNVGDLMLRQDVVEAVREGRFRVFAVTTIDEGMEILTGVPAGQRDSSGKFPEGSVNHRVEERLVSLAERQIELAAKAKQEMSQ
ncbi:MAG: AAA family ATPase [Bryobacterales bacterium]|nr:AAA family ATPase [Bryobacterales bacterium]